MPPKRKPQIQSRNWVFTLNNYTDKDIQDIKEWDVQCVRYGKEVGENKTPHLQGTSLASPASSGIGMMQFKKKVDFNVVKNLHPRIHIEKMKGNWQQSLDYCSKESALEGFGEADEAGKSKTRQAMAKAILDGETDEAKLFEEFGGTYLSIYRGVKHGIDLIQAKRNPPQPPAAPWGIQEPKRYMIWLFGNAGTGKDRRAQGFCYEAGRSLYRHDSSQGMWFDNYRGEQAVLFSDFSGHKMQYSTWKDLFDPMKESFQAQVKGKTGGVTVKATHVYFTAQNHPIETWKCLRQEKNNWDQVERRLSQILYVTEDINGPECTSQGFADIKGQEPPPAPAKEGAWKNKSLDLDEQKYQDFLNS